MGKSLFSTSDIKTHSVSQAPHDKTHAESFELSKPVEFAFQQAEKVAEILGENLGSQAAHVFVTKGRWDMADMLFHLLKISGPAVVTFCTWQINEDAVRRMYSACEDGLILQLNALLDRRIKIRRETSLEFIKNFASKINHAGDCHAKILVVESKTHVFGVIGSANFTTNKRLEAGVIIGDKDICNKLHKYLLSEIDEVR